MNRALKPILLTLLAAAMVGLLDARFHFARLLRQGRPTDTRELAARFLGEHLARHYPGKRVLVLANPYTQEPGHPREIYRYEEAALRGLQQGLGEEGRFEGVVYPRLNPEHRSQPRAAVHPATTTPLSYLLAPGAIDTVVRENPKADILVSLIGLPVGITRSSAWQREGRPRFAFLLPDVNVLKEELELFGDRGAVRRALESGKIAALVLNKPGAPPEDEPLGKDLRAEFERRFLLVWAGNLETSARAFPQRFPPPMF